MKYTIKVSNPGSHFCNPLLALDGQEYATHDGVSATVEELG